MATAAELIRPLADGWRNKINIAGEQKKRLFQEFADECMQFYTGVSGFMFDPRFVEKYIGGQFSPRFKITLNKAFELVAVMGPLLYARNPSRRLAPYLAVEFGPEVFGDPNDPQVQLHAQQMLGQQAMQFGRRKTACALMERYLNYTPYEQPGGGLRRAAGDALTEALIKGRGVLWPGAYRMPGSNRLLTGCFYDTVDRLLIDPDAESEAFGEAMWIAREHVKPHWIPERKYGLPFGTLRSKYNMESAEARAAISANGLGNLERNRGTTYDLCRYWEIWSTAGVGTRLTGVPKFMQQAFDDVVGDYAYVVIADGYHQPLNMAGDKIGQASSDEVRQQFAWPVEYWRDRRWPCALLDFYRIPRSTWPMSVLRAGLGELIALNIIISKLVSNIYASSQQLIGVLRSAMKDVENALSQHGERVIVPINDIHKNINEIIHVLDMPEVQISVWQIIDRLFQLFDKRTGLSELLYGMAEGAMSRSATDVKIRDERISARPEHMANTVEEWMTEAAQMEKLCAYFAGVSGDDVRPLLGDVGAMLWDQLIAGERDPEVIAREMLCTVETGSAKKRNRERDISNIKEVYPSMSSQLEAYRREQGDPRPSNELNKRLFDAFEMDGSGLEMQPGMPPQQQAAAQQTQ